MCRLLSITYTLRDISRGLLLWKFPKATKLWTKQLKDPLVANQNPEESNGMKHSVRLENGEVNADINETDEIEYEFKNKKNSRQEHQFSHESQSETSKY